MPWPYSIPAGLRRRIDSVLGQRSHGAAEIWGDVRDWLEENSVEMRTGSRSSERPRVARSGISERGVQPLCRNKLCLWRVILT
jgi:hypothetical protein